MTELRFYMQNTDLVIVYSWWMCPHWQMNIGIRFYPFLSNFKSFFSTKQILSWALKGQFRSIAEGMMPNEEAKLVGSLKSINKEQFLVQLWVILYSSSTFIVSVTPNAEANPGGIRVNWEWRGMVWGGNKFLNGKHPNGS